MDKGIPIGRLNIKEAIEFTVRAWNTVQPSTIANCWRKTGILPNVDCAGAEAEVQRVAHDALAKVSSFLSELEPVLANPISADQYLTIEDELDTEIRQMMMDTEIVEMVVGPREQEEDNEPESETATVVEPWSDSQVLSVLDNLLVF
jgi:hypothetical protein